MRGTRRPSTGSSSNSIITTGVGTFLELSLAILCAYAFVFVDFRFKKIAFALIIASMMLPGHVTLIVNYITVANLGWLNSYAGIILPGIAAPSRCSCSTSSCEPSTRTSCKPRRSTEPGICDGWS